MYLARILLLTIVAIATSPAHAAPSDAECNAKPKAVYDRYREKSFTRSHLGSENVFGAKWCELRAQEIDLEKQLHELSVKFPSCVWTRSRQRYDAEAESADYREHCSGK